MSKKLSILVWAGLAAGAAMGAASPDGRAEYEFGFAGGRVEFRVKYDGKDAATVRTGEGWKSAKSRGGAERFAGGWETVWGDRKTVKEAYRREWFDAVDGDGRAVEVEARIYDEGFAFRSVLKGGGEFAEKTSVDWPAGARAWAITGTEATYPEAALEIAEGDAEWMTPLTVEVEGVASSFFEAHAVGYPRMRAKPRAGGVEVKLLQEETPKLKAGAGTPWRALQLAGDAAGLVENSTLILNLNPPCAIEDTSWIKPGLTMSNLSNCRLENGELLEAARAGKEMGARYLQLDWGWYGTEWGWSDADRERYLKTNPEMAEEGTWRGNTTGNARRTAKGAVPYLPGWKRQFDVDLDFGTLIPELKKLGCGLSLYVRGRVLEKENLDELFGLYRGWGVEGVKPGFVRYGTAEATDWLRGMLAAAARHRLWVDIHDEDVPDGRQRTWPNLFLTEGVGGEEGKHPVRQDVTIPFARGLAGPYDYTPMVFTAGRSQAHVLAMLLCQPGPSAVVRGPAAAREKLGATGSCWGLGDAKEWVKALPWRWDETRVTDAAIGRKIVVARRSGREWFAAGMSGEGEERTKLGLGFLEPGVEYRMTTWEDDLADGEAAVRRMRKRVETVRAGERVEIVMAGSGGFLARWRPLDGNAGEKCLSGEGWWCEGAPVRVPHTWNAVDGADGLGVPEGQPGHNSASSGSYWRGAKTYRRALPGKEKGKRHFVRCDGVSIKAEVRVNGKLAGRHVGAFSGFTFEVTELLKESGNELEITADNTYDPEVPPNEGDFTMYGGVYRDVWWITKPEVCIDPLRNVRVHADCETGEVRAEVPVSGGEDEVQKFSFGKPELWSPENPKLYAVTVTAGTDRATVKFGFRKAEFREDGFYLNGKKRVMRGVCRHQDRIGKGWAVSESDEAEDVEWIKRMGADAVRTSHYPQSPAFYRMCDEKGLMVWTELPVVDEVPKGEKFRKHALEMAREMVEQNANHPSIVTWGVFNEVYQFRKADGSAEPLLRELRDEIKRLDPGRAVVGASNKDLGELCAVPDELGMNLYPGWYGKAGAEGMAERIGKTLKASGRKSICVSEYGGGGCIESHADALERPAPVSRFHPEEYQAWLHRCNYMGIAGNPGVWGSFVWVMFDLGSDSRQEGVQAGRNDKGLVTGDRKTAKDAWHFYKCNWNPEPELRVVGERESATTNGTRTVVVFSNAPEVMFRLNGKLYGAQAPDRVKTCVWKGVKLQPGENELEFRAGPITRRVKVDYKNKEGSKE